MCVFLDQPKFSVVIVVIISVVNGKMAKYWPWKSKSTTLPETNSLHLKMDGWNTIVSFCDGLFSGAMLVSWRVFIEGFFHKDDIALVRV